MGFFGVLGAALKTIWTIFCEVVTTAVVDFMAFIPWPFKIFPDSVAGFFMLLGLIAVSIGVGFVAGRIADKVKKNPKAEPFWPAFGIAVVGVFVVFAILVAIFG